MGECILRLGLFIISIFWAKKGLSLCRVFVIHENEVKPDLNSVEQRARSFGVDVDLVLSNLKLTPEERLLRHQEALILVLELDKAREQNDKHTRPA